MLKNLIDLIQEAGESTLQYFGKPVQTTIKSDHTPLTEADLRSNQILTEGLTRLTPDIPIISEEAPIPHIDIRRNWPAFWIVDPIDGTKSFLKHRPQYTVNVALIENGEPTVGLLYVPAIHTLYGAEKGKGAWKQIRSNPAVPIQANSTPNDPLQIGCSSMHFSQTDHDMVQKVRQRYPSELKPISSALKFGLIAEGVLDLYFRTTRTMEWDTAPGHLIAEEAGCGVRTFPDNGKLTYNKPTMQNPGYWVKPNSFPFSI